MTKADIIRRAVASYAYLDEEAGPNTDQKVDIVRKESNELLKDVVLP